jgi:hypothetical protein
MIQKPHCFRFFIKMYPVQFSVVKKSDVEFFGEAIIDGKKITTEHSHSILKAWQSPQKFLLSKASKPFK